MSDSWKTKITNWILLPILIALVILFAYKKLKVPITARSAVDSIQNIESKAKPYSKAKHKDVINQKKYKSNVSDASILSSSIRNNDIESPILGNPNAAHVITWFFDYKCIYCKQANSALNELIKKRDDVKIILKPIYLSKNSSVDFKFSLATYNIDKEKFQIVHNALFDTQQEDINNYIVLLSKHDVDLSNIEDIISRPILEKLLINNQELANKLNIQVIPAYLIGNKILTGALEVEELNQILEQNDASNNNNNI